MNTRFTTKSLGVALALGALSIGATAHAGGHGITPQEKKLIAQVGYRGLSRTRSSRSRCTRTGSATATRKRGSSAPRATCR